MKRSVFWWQLAGFLLFGIFGTGLHFFFELTNSNPLAGLISAVNESIWEHMKLLFYPMLIFALIQYRFCGKVQPGYWCTKLKGILLGLLLIPVLYYSYTGILGTSADWFNITIFFLAAGTAYWWETRQFQKEVPCNLSGKTVFICITLLVLLFTFLTFFPPKIPFFQDPVTETYGYYKTEGTA